MISLTHRRSLPWGGRPDLHVSSVFPALSSPTWDVGREAPPYVLLLEPLTLQLQGDLSLLAMIS